MTDRKYEIREAGNGFLSKLGTGVVAVGSVAAAVVAVSPQGVALESLIYNPEAMPANNIASGTAGSSGTGLEGEQAAATAGGVPPTLEDYLVLGDIYPGSQPVNGEGSAFLELGSILNNAQGGGSVGNVTNSTQYATGGGNSTTGDAGNVTGSTPTAGGGNGGTGNTGGNGNTTSPTPGGGTGEDSYGEDSHGEDSYGEDSHGEDSHGEDSHSED
jgi:hypothetical protein